MTRTVVIVLSVIFVLLVVVFIAGRYAGVFSYYRITGSSNEPTLKNRSMVFTSNLKNPERYDFIIYKHHGDNKITPYVYRLCGLPGDKIVIKNGELFVNGQSTDKLFSTYLHYRLSAQQFADIKPFLKSISDEENHDSASDEIIVPLTREFAAKHNLLSAQIIHPYEPHSQVEEEYHQPWSIDNFGPLVIPEGRYFMLGDNRHYALDSRYTGLVNEDDFIATVLNKK